MLDSYFVSSYNNRISEDDYNYLLTYIQNIKNNIPNTNMIILLGKTLLINEISKYIGLENVCCVDIYEFKRINYLEPKPKLIHFIMDDVFDISESNIPKYTKHLNIALSNGISIITEANILDEKFLNHINIKIINIL